MTRFTFALLALAFLVLPISSSLWARDPVPFTDPYQDGLVLTFWTDTYSDEEIERRLIRVKQTGTKHLTIAWWGCQPTVDSNEVGSCVHFSRESILRAARIAQKLGFNASFLPLVGSKDGTWRGYYRPTDLDRWFETYTAWITSVARDARDLGMKELVVGTEYNSLAMHEDRWRQVIREVRKVFPGPLIYTVNWDDLDHSFYDEADAIGVSGYFTLSSASDPSQSVLNKAWQKLHKKLMAMSRKWRRPIHMTEVGYTNSANAASKPWGITGDDPLHPTLQEQCYEAFTQAWRSEKGLVRVNFWSTEGVARDGSVLALEPLGMPAEGLIRQFALDRAGLR